MHSWCILFSVFQFFSFSVYFCARYSNCFLYTEFSVLPSIKKINWFKCNSKQKAELNAHFYL